MRPQILFPLFRTVDSLPGVGPKIAALIRRLAGEHVIDLCWHLPTGMIDRRASPPLARVSDGDVVTLKVEIVSHAAPPRGKGPYRVTVRAPDGFFDLVFFHAHKDYLERQLPVGEMRVVSGRVEHYRDRIQMPHPDHVVPPSEEAAIRKVEPVYPLTAGLAPRTLAKAVAAAVALAPDLPEWQDPAWRQRKAWPGWRKALVGAHAPDAPAGILPECPPRERLAYDELLANQLALLLLRRSMRTVRGRPLKGDGQLRQKVVAALPFSLTGSQRQALAEIAADMAEEARMLRLLQGDVGSGKTVVALLAMLNAVEAGCQAALLAPTEILARQHFETLEPLARAAGVPIGILTGRDRGKPRQAVLDALASGALPLVVGTHALVQEEVAFRDLGFAVIDEQHRFGVSQRMRLSAKGRGVDLLVMTATPIPRTLALTAYGDMDVSRLIEKPPGRKPVATRAVPIDRLDDLLQGLERKIAAGEKVYWVCPLVDESEAVDVAAATARLEFLERRFPGRVGLVHGRMKGPEKDSVMARFAEGDLAVLVATTVIEVGVNVPAATVMIIEHAERFGLAQLHQLRGRVGRGELAASCILLYAQPLTQTAEERLRTIRETDDGFVIAEADLKLRGAGELLGTRQSGLPEWRLADPVAHAELLQVARDDARLIVERDPELKTGRGEALRLLLYLFERDAAARLWRSG
ncbi:MAG: ATP-dependent DNA helicase RecG [Azospirillaceae bacterium]